MFGVVLVVICLCPGRQLLGFFFKSFHSWFWKPFWKLECLVASIVWCLALPACVLTPQVHLHLFAILIYHSITLSSQRSFFFWHSNLCPTYVHLHHLSILTSQIRCNLFSSAVLSWQGGRGVVNSTQGGSCHGWTDRPLDRWYRRVRSRVPPCEQRD